jgi:DNA polymerase/3'-5' exonuclease PolX
MGAPDKQRWPRATGLIVAEELVERLRPACAAILVAGSLRRGNPDVGDVEIVFIPLITSQPDPGDMFAVKDVSCAELEIDRMLAAGFLTKRLNVNGGETWGYRNKLARHAASGMPVDLFGATRANWFNNLVCRTGPAESNMRIAQAAQARGWKWNPYGEGFSRGGHDDVEFESRAMTNEAAVFEFVGLPVPEWAKIPTD